MAGIAARTYLAATAAAGIEPLHPKGCENSDFSKLLNLENKNILLFHFIRIMNLLFKIVGEGCSEEL